MSRYFFDAMRFTTSLGVDPRWRCRFALKDIL
jgi:hypothetical protein